MYVLRVFRCLTVFVFVCLSLAVSVRLSLFVPVCLSLLRLFLCVYVRTLYAFTCMYRYGFAIGNMAAFDMDDPDAIVSPGGVGIVFVFVFLS